MKIELRRGLYGAKLVHVDGSVEPWARITSESMGPRGLAYKWHQCGNNRTVTVPAKGLAEKDRPYVMHTQISDQYRSPGDPGQRTGTVCHSTEDRLRAVTEHMIEQGWLREPTKLREEAMAAEAVRAAERAKWQKKQDRAWRTRAAKCLEPLDRAGGLPLSKTWEQQIVANIVAAMKWAQSQ